MSLNLFLPIINLLYSQFLIKGVATTKKELIDYTKCFLNNGITYDGMAECYLDWLRKNEFVSFIDLKDDDSDQLEKMLKPTQLGYAVVASAMSPDEGITIL